MEKKIKKNPLWWIEDNAGTWYMGARERRRNAVSMRNTLPDLSSALEEYSRNIDTIIDLAKKRSIRLIFVTQPAMWEAGLPKQLEGLLWFGWIYGSGEYYSVESLATGMKMYNETLLKVCQRRGIECLDLAARLPKDTTVFYDDCHFNETGAEQVAEAIAEYMLQRSPFNPPSRSPRFASEAGNACQQ